MRRASKVDANQPGLVGYLRSQGAVVDIVSHVPGIGYDLIVGFMGGYRAAFCEVKDPEQPPSKREFTDSEKKAALRWGTTHVKLETQSDCDELLGELRGVAR